MKWGIPLLPSLSLVIENRSLAVILLDLVFFSFSFFIFIFCELCVCVWGGRVGSMCSHTGWRSEDNLQCSSLPSRQSLAYYLVLSLQGFASFCLHLALCCHLAPGALGLQMWLQCTALCFYLSSGCLNPGSHVCMANTLPIEPSFQSQTCYSDDACLSANTH